MEKQSTVEGKAKTKNGVKRMVFALLSIVLELFVIFTLLTRLSEHAFWIEAVVRILALGLVLGIYAQSRTSAMKMPWIILILTAPFFGVTLYLLVGVNGGTHAMRKRFDRIDKELLPLLSKRKKENLTELLRDMDPAASGIALYLDQQSGYPLWQNTDVLYFDDAAKGLDAQLEDMRKAEKFIFMEYHAIEDGTSWHRIEEVLEKKASEGVEVRVFYDDMGSIGFITTDFVKKLKGKGIACQVFNPFGPGLNLFLNNRDHRKITVIDGKVGYTGGYNLANEYFNLTHPYGEWKDTGIRLEGDAVPSLTIMFLEMWNAGKRTGDFQDKDFGKYLPVYKYKAVQKGFIQPYGDSPMDQEQVGEEVYISMAEKAEKYCYFVTPYLILTDEMTHALVLAAKRGVDVRIITPGIPDKKLVYNVTRSFYPALVKNGVRIYEWTPGFCHCKMSVADDKMATCGTINMDYRSLYHHFENGCWIYEKNIASEIRRDFEVMISQSTEVTKQYQEGKSSFLRFSQLILRLFAELL